MRVGILGWLVVALLAQAAGAVATLPDDVLAQAEQDGHARVIVRLAAPLAPAGRRESADERASRSLAIAASRGRVLERLAPEGDPNLRSYHALPYLALDATPAQLRRLARDPEVLALEPNRRMRPAIAQSIPWVGASQTKLAGYNGSGWAIAILDSGVETTHSWLSGRVVEEACFSSGRDCPEGKTTQYGPGSAAPCTYASTCFHGTHIAGIAAGAATSHGMAPAAQLISIQVSSSDTCDGTPCIAIDTDDAVAALEYVEALADSHAIAAVNLSFGTSSTWNSESSCNSANALFRDAIQLVTDRGIAVAAAAGNANVTSGINAPACISYALGVSATNDSNDALWISSATLGSNTGVPLDFFAPGSPITSSKPGNTTGTHSGTSMATPHVAAAFALLRQADPGASLASLTATLASTAVSATDTRNGLTRPRIDVSAAVRARAPAQCFDGIDNDSDGYVDVDGNGTGYPDPDCSSGFDDLEQLQTSSGCGMGPELVLALPLLALARRNRARG